MAQETRSYPGNVGPGGVVPHIAPGVRVGLPTRPGAGTYKEPKPKARPKGPPPGHKGSHPHGQHAGPPPKPPAEPDIFEMTPAQRHAFATKTVRQNTQTELEPYKQRGAELGNQELATGRRYGAYGQAADTLIGQQQAGAEASAKSFLNQVADSTLKAEKGVETTGQNTQAGNAGYLDPQVAQALAAQRAVVAGTGAAQRGAAETTGQAETNYMSNLRAAAAQRVSEGQAGIAGQYGKLQGQNLQGENRLLAKVPGQIAAKEGELAQTAFNQRAVQAKIELEGGKLKVAQTEAGTKASKARTEGEVAKSKLGIEGAKVGIEGKKYESDAAYKKALAAYRNFSAKDKDAYDKAQIKYKKYQEGHGGAIDPKQASTYLSGISRTEAVARSLIPGGGKVRKDRALQEQIRKGLREKGANADQISAAMNLIVYGKLGPQDRRRMEENGVDPALRPTWFR